MAFKWMRFKMLRKEPSFLIVWASEVTASSSAVFGCSLCRRPRPALHSQAFTSYADFTDYFMEKTEQSFYITCSFNSKLFRCFFLRAFFPAPHQWVYKIVFWLSPGSPGSAQCPPILPPWSRLSPWTFLHCFLPFAERFGF